MDDRHPSAHEASTVDLRAIAVAASIVAGGIALAIAVPWVIVAHGPSPVNAPNNARRPAIAGPVQPTAPALERQAYERAKRVPPAGDAR
jgi:hypothetical protein